MARNHDCHPFLFPSNFPSYPSESTTPPPSSPSPSPFCSSQSASSFNSPFNSSPSPPRRLHSGSSSSNLPPASFGPCPACKFHCRRCSDNCYLASFLPPNEVHKVAVAESVFGSGNVDSFLQKNGNSSYTPLLLLLKDKSQADGDINSIDNKDDALSKTEVNNELGVCIGSNNELRIRELIQELKVHLSSSFSSDTNKEYFVQKIFSSFEKSLSILYWSDMRNPAALLDTASNDPESPMYVCDSPGSGSVNFDGAHSVTSKKRKLEPTTRLRVHVSNDSGQEGPPDDSYRWRKYGQKDVLGVKYPRSYYRCNHIKCRAMKHIQRCDEDPMVFEVTYCGYHTCSPPEKDQEEAFTKYP